MLTIRKPKKIPRIDKMSSAEIKEAATLTDIEMAFINKIARSAFERNSRPLVHFAICGAIVQNVVLQSNGKINKKLAQKLVAMAAK